MSVMPIYNFNKKIIYRNKTKFSDIALFRVKKFKAKCVRQKHKSQL